jgi:hypothetical protein
MDHGRDARRGDVPLMPRVPVPAGLESSGLHPLPTPYGDTSVSPQAFGAGVGGAIEGAGDVVGEFARDARREANAAQVMNAIGMVKKAQNDLILDPENGYVGKMGDDALKARKPTLDAYEESIKNAAATLQNDDQRRMWTQHEITLRDQGYQHVVSHEAVQIKDAALAKASGAIDQTTRALQSPAVISNPADRDQHLADLENLARGKALVRFGQSATPEAIASVVGPAMQQAGLDAMEAAVATKDPTIVSDTFQKVGPMLGVHQHVYGKIVQSIQAQAAIHGQASGIIAHASTPVAMPGGVEVARLDATKLDAELAKVPQDSPYRAEIEKEVERRQAGLDKAWNTVVAQTVARVQSAGTDPNTGAFSLQGAAVSPRDRLWLQQNAPDKLIALSALDARLQRQHQKGASTEEREASRDALGDLLLDMADPGRRSDFYGPMSAADFNEALNDQPLTAIDRKSAIREFAKVKAEAGKLTDKAITVAKEEIAKAFPTQPDKAKKYMSALMQDLNQFVAQEKERNNGKAPADADLRARAAYMLARPPGEHWWNSPDRRIDSLVQQSLDAAKTGPVVTTSGTSGFRYSKDRKTRYPADAHGNRLGPNERVP